MSADLDVASAAAIGEMSAGGKADLSGQQCRNCGMEVDKRFCANCGQLAASFHRPIWSLLGETITDSFALDGRLARTLPLLFFRPGRLTKAYISGQRARYVPPFRLFLLASVVFYFSLFAMIARTGAYSSLNFSGVTFDTAEMSEEQRARIDDELIDENGHIDGDFAISVLTDEANGEVPPVEVIDRIVAVRKNPALFRANIEKWGPRLSIGLLPLTIIALATLHFWRRRIYIYDHAIHALHLHSWMYLTGAVVILLVPYTGGGLWGWYVAAFAFYCWRSLIVSYGTNWGMALLRLLLLALFWVIIVFALVLAAIIVSGLAVPG